MECYIGIIEVFAGNKAPANWMFCQGQTLPISNYQALFAVIGTTFGGDGKSTFCLPNLMGAVPVGWGKLGTDNVPFGSKGGSQTVALQVAELPQHTHDGIVNIGASTSNTPSSSSYLAQAGKLITGVFVQSPTYINSLPGSNASADAISSAGGTQAHANVMPTLSINYMICVEGMFPVNPN